MLLVVRSASAQEALQNMEAGSAAADSRAQTMKSLETQDYTFKRGDFRMMIVPSLGLQYNDNVNLANTNALDDFIVTPAVEIKASYPLTQENLLYLDVTVGYDWYLKNPEFSAFDLNSSSGTGLSFDVGIKDVTVNFHDWVSYTQGSGQNSSVSNPGGGFVGNSVNGSVANTATYGTFENTAGLSATWNMNKLTLSAGYDHQNVISTSDQFNQEDHSSEMIFGRGGLQLNPRLSTGLEATAAFTSYDQSVLNDGDMYTVGPYIQFQPSTAMTIVLRGGYTINNFQNTSTVIQTSSQDSWYASLNISHQPTKYLTYSLDVGREVQLGVVSDLLEDWYVRPNATLNVVNGLPITAYFFYEHGNQGAGSVGSVPGNSNGTFEWYGGGFSVQHEFTSRLALGLIYRLTLHSSGITADNYTQNLIALQLSYHAK